MRIFVLLISVLALFSSCTPEPQPIAFGEDDCHFCKMTIVDQRYGAELVTSKGKIYKFDALECMINAAFKENLVEENSIHSLLVVPYDKPGNLISAIDKFYLQSRNLPSPMGMYISAFSEKEAAKDAQSANGGELLDWEGVKKKVLAGEKPAIH